MLFFRLFAKELANLRLPVTRGGPLLGFPVLPVGIGLLDRQADPTAFLVGTPALLISALGVAASIGILLAFMPPRAWQAWIEARAAQRTT